MRWPFLLLLAVLPLQWFVVVGPVRVHLAAMTALLVLVLLTHRARAFVPVLRLTAVFVVANVALCVVWMGAALYHGDGLRQPVQQLIYLAVFVAVGTVVCRGLAGGDRTRWLTTMRWSALVVNVSLVGALSLSLARNGVNPAAVFGQTLAAGDPEILQKELFRSAFTGFGFGEDVVRGNFRHEIFGAVLVAMLLSSACVGIDPFRSRAAHRLYQVSLVVGVFLIVVSMSRSVMIAAAAWPLLSVMRSALDGRPSPRLMGGAILTMLAALVLNATGLLNVVWVRFTEDTGSYEARDNLLELARQNIHSNLVTGGVTTAGSSSHNFVLDTWLRAGVFAAAAAAAVLVVLLGLVMSLGVRLHREPLWLVPVTAMIVLPLVRIFTAGGGLIPPVSWVGLGIAAGFLVHRRNLLIGRDATSGMQLNGDQGRTHDGPAATATSSPAT